MKGGGIKKELKKKKRQKEDIMKGEHKKLGFSFHTVTLQYTY